MWRIESMAAAGGQLESTDFTQTEPLEIFSNCKFAFESLFTAYVVHSPLGSIYSIYLYDAWKQEATDRTVALFWKCSGFLLIVVSLSLCIIECGWPQCFLCSAGLWRGTAAFPPVHQKAEAFPPNVWSVAWCCSTLLPCGPAQTHWFIRATVMALITKKHNKPPGCSLWATSLISGTQEQLRSDNHRGRWNISPVHQCVAWAVLWTAQPAWTRGASWACSVRWYTGDPRHLTAQPESSEGKHHCVFYLLNTIVLWIWTCTITDI